MERGSLYDEMFALASGTLSPEEAAALRQRCGMDPELRALLEGFLEVHALTEGGDSPPPACRLSFEDVMGAPVPQRAWRKVLRRALATAAAVLVLVGTGFFLTRAIPGRHHRPGGGEAGRPLVLAAIPPAGEAAPETGPEIPDALADYRPVLGGKVQWLPSIEAASTLARTTSRPVLLFLYHPACCICTDMRDGTFADPEVQAKLDAFVPALVDVRKAPRPIVELARQGFPWLGALDAGGRVIISFPGGRGAVDFLDRLKEAATLAGPPVLLWEEVHAISRRLAEGRADLGQGRFAAAWRRLEPLAADFPGSDLGRAAARGLDRISAAAREALLDAAGHPPAEALAALRDAGEAFADTPFAGDFDAVRARLLATGRFPEFELAAPLRRPSGPVKR
ncbi:MAG: thioredoxin family protein [Planctomycetes bacterium]|jgi:hypothetical protein|nr:thioredoxin family protein [Planctomycetota bacterium]